MTEEELKTLPPDPAEIVIEVETAPPGKSAADEASEKLKQQLEAAKRGQQAALETADAERQARLVAEQRAREREQEAIQSRGEVHSSELQRVTGAIDAVTRQIEAAEREHERALEAGEWAKVSKAQTQLSEAAAQRVALLRDKNYIESMAHTAPRAEGRIEQPQPQPDVVEAFISSATPATQSWLRAHRDLVVKDGRGVPKLDSRVMAAHYQADADGIKPDTPEYFQFIEGRLNPAHDESLHEPDPPPQQQQRRQTPVAAPVSREAPGMNGQQKQRIKLTASQVEAAHMFGDPKKTPREREIDYWNNMQVLTAEGRIGNTQH